MDQGSLSARKRTLLWALLLLTTYLFIEGIAFAAISFLQHSVFTYGKVTARIAAAGSAQAADTGHQGTTEVRWGDYVEAIHPYFGFVADPEKNRAFWQVSDLGFVFDGSTDPITQRSSDRLIVAVFGGSFSSGEYAFIKKSFETKAAALGKQAVVLNFSAAGYKQPQHLLVLSYLLARGAQFDLVVNIDGFNEVTLPFAENIPSHVNPFYPRGWDRRASGTISQATIRQIGRIEYLKTQKTSWASVFLGHRLYLSPTLSLVWQLRDVALSRQIYRAEQELSENDRQGASFSTHGPKYTSENDEQLFHDLAAMWKNSSKQMHALCAAAGIEYYHFLQPNQYVPDSKPMEAEERAKAITPGHPYARGVLKGYPVLRKAGDELKREGVNFYDLTQIFSGESRPVYDDDCCHLNATGYAIVADRISAEIEKVHRSRN